MDEVFLIKRLFLIRSSVVELDDEVDNVVKSLGETGCPVSPRTSLTLKLINQTRSQTLGNPAPKRKEMNQPKARTKNETNA